MSFWNTAPRELLVGVACYHDSISAGMACVYVSLQRSTCTCTLVCREVHVHVHVEAYITML